MAPLSMVSHSPVEGPLNRSANEIRRQPAALTEFERTRLPVASKGSIFVGAGDSYAAAMAAFYASRTRCIALDPYVLTVYPEMASRKEVFFISASGNTKANVEAAVKVKGVAEVTTAITADGASRLASSTSQTLRLPISPSPRAPGLLSFTLSLLAALKISTGYASCDFDRALHRAKKDSLEVSLARGTTYFLGNALAHSAAIYSAAKVREFLGTKSQGELLEEFSHLELFSLKRSDSVNIFSCFDPDGGGRELTEALSDKGYEARSIPSRGESDTERLFHSVFVSQLAVLKVAEEQGLPGPRFLSEKAKLGVSDSRIY